MAATSGRSPRRATLLQAAKTVFWAFFGVRGGKDHAAVRLTPVQIIVTAIIGATLFVLTIVTVVQLVTR